MSGSRSMSLCFTDKEYSFILNMAKQCAGNSDSGTSAKMVLRTLIRLLQQLEVDVSGVETEDQLLRRLQDAIR